MSQSIVSDRFPYLRLDLEVGDTRHRIETLIDTGFDGSVAVPRGFLPDRLVPDGESRCFLADGSAVAVPYYHGRVGLNGLGPFDVLILSVGEELLVGREVTDRFTLILDHGRQVRIEP